MAKCAVFLVNHITFKLREYVIKCFYYYLFIVFEGLVHFDDYASFLTITAIYYLLILYNTSFKNLIKKCVHGNEYFGETA